MDGREEAPPFGHVSGARERRVNDEEEGTIVGSGPTRADSEYTRHAMSPGEGEDWVLSAEALKEPQERLHGRTRSSGRGWTRAMSSSPVA